MGTEPGVGSDIYDAIPLFAAAFMGLNKGKDLQIMPVFDKSKRYDRIHFRITHELARCGYPYVANALSGIAQEIHAVHNRSLRYRSWSLSGFDELRARDRRSFNPLLSHICTKLQARKMRTALIPAKDDMETLRALARWFHESITQAIEEHGIDLDLQAACQLVPKAVVNTLDSFVPILADKLIRIRKETSKSEVCIRIQNQSSIRSKQDQVIAERFPWLENVRLRLTPGNALLEGMRWTAGKSEWTADALPEEWRLSFPQMETLTSDAVTRYVVALFQHWTVLSKTAFPDSYSGVVADAPPELKEHYRFYLH